MHDVAALLDAESDVERPPRGGERARCADHVIIGEALVGSGSLGLSIAGAVMGSVLFRLLVAIALRWGLDPNDLKLVTAVFVFLALVAPNFLSRLGKRPALGEESRVGAR